jgi:hypothetical protein
MPRKVKEPVPAGPFQRHIENRVAYFASIGEEPTMSVCREFGWSTTEHPESGLRRLYRFRYGKSDSRRGRKNGSPGVPVKMEWSVYERAVVEDALHCSGFGLEDLYPRELYPALYVDDDIPLEDEMFCAGCQDHCTPIRGECPWCDGTILIPNVPRVDVEQKKAA